MFCVYKCTKLILILCLCFGRSGGRLAKLAVPRFSTRPMKKHYYSRLVLAIFNHLIWITDIWIATQAEIRRQAWNDEIWTNIQVNAVVCRRFVIIRRNFVPISFHSSEMMFCSLLVDQFNPMERINVVYRTFMASNYQKTMPNNISSTLLLV